MISTRVFLFLYGNGIYQNITRRILYITQQTLEISIKIAFFCVTK